MTFWTSSVFTGLAPSGVVEAYASREARELASRFPELCCCRVAFESGGPSGPSHVRVALVTGDVVLHVGAGADAGSTTESLCELTARAFDRAVTALEARAARRSLRGAAQSWPPIAEAC